jgi:hypothetical protein
MEFEARGAQGGAPIIREGTAPRPALSPDDLGLGIWPSFELSFDGTHPADVLLEFLLGVTVRLIDRLGGFPEVVEMTQLVGHLGQGGFHGAADGELPVGDHSGNRHAQRLLDSTQQGCQIIVRGRQQATGEEHLTGQTIAQYPEHLVADVGLKPIQRKDDAALGLGDALEASGIRQGEGHKFIVAFQEVQDCAGSQSNTAMPQLLMDLRDAPMLGIAQCTYQGDDIETKFVLGQGKPSLFLRSVGPLKLGTCRGKTAANLESQAQDT